MAKIYVKYNNRIALYNINIIDKNEIIKIIEELNENKISNRLIRFCTDLLKDEVIDIFEFSIEFNNIINSINNRVELGYIKRILNNIKLKRINTNDIVVRIDNNKKGIINRLIKDDKTTAIIVPKEFEEHINDELKVINEIKLNNVPNDINNKVKIKLYNKFPNIDNINEKMK